MSFSVQAIVITFAVVFGLDFLWKVFVPWPIYPSFSVVDDTQRRFWRPYIYHSARSSRCEVIWWTGTRYVKYGIEVGQGEGVIFTPVRPWPFDQRAVRYFINFDGKKTETVGSPFHFDMIRLSAHSKKIDALPNEAAKAIQKARRILKAEFPNGAFEDDPLLKSWGIKDPSPWLQEKSAAK